MGHIGSRSKWWPGVRRHHAGVPRPEDFEASDSYLKSNSANGQRGKCRHFLSPSWGRSWLVAALGNVGAVSANRGGGN